MEIKDILLLIIVILASIALVLGAYILIVKFYYAQKIKKENDMFNPENLTKSNSLVKAMTSRRRPIKEEKEEEEKTNVFIKNADLFKNTKKDSSGAAIDPFHIKKDK